MDQQIKYLTQVCSDFAATLPPSARGPFIQAAQQAIDAIKAKLAKGLPTEVPDVPST